MTISFLDAAIVELDDAFEYYEYQQQKLGYRFVGEVQNALNRISSYPQAWHKFSHSTRRCLVKNFPYGVIYKEQDEGSILIIAIMNLHRKPNYWANRIKK